MIPPFLLRQLFALGGFLLLVGCTLPTPGYRKVDPTTAEFREMTARISASLQEKGVGMVEADQRAVQAVTRQIVAAQKQNRPQQVKPLAAALDAFDQPRGCWAYTVTTRTRTDGKLTTQVETFDASQPESHLWTLISRNERTPDDREQSEYREQKLRRWKKSLTRSKPRHMDSDHLAHDAIFADLKIGPESSGQTRFVFVREKMSIPVMGTITGRRTSYLVDDATGRLRGVTDLIGPNSMVFGIRALLFETSVEFMNVDDSVPPFISRSNAHYHIIGFGKDTGEVERESVYSNYRRVKCFEERFNVRVGIPEVQDFLPE
ncbi:MAG: hypothetical protein ABIZ81_18620 [Opitutaceae bacterium]